MSSNLRRFDCAPDDVFRVLADGWLYPGWVVGASRIRDVEDAWPAVGSVIHHSFGIWPFVVNDTTEVEEYEAPTHLVMTARGWPIGEARVVLDVEPRKNGGCYVRIREDAVSGPALLLPTFLRNVLLHIRNAETLRRLRFLAEGRAAG
jgi:hypothetical protein